MLRDLVFSGWMRVWWRRWQWWWWRWHWLPVVVTVAVWGGMGLALCRYWRIPLRPHAHPGGGDPIQNPHMLHSQASGYRSSQSSEDASDRLAPINNIKAENRHVAHYDTTRLSVINLHMSDVSQKRLSNSLKSPHDSGLQYQQDSAKYSDTSITFHGIGLDNHNTNLDLLTEVSTSTKDNDIPKHMAIHDNHSNRHHTLKLSYGTNNIFAKNLLPAKSNTEEKDEARQTNRTTATDNESYVRASQGEKVKEQDGAPRVILLLTSWRSGSTFMGELLASAVPETFYR